jgi:hypothetical protein
VLNFLVVLFDLNRNLLSRIRERVDRACFSDVVLLFFDSCFGERVLLFCEIPVMNEI